MTTNQTIDGVSRELIERVRRHMLNGTANIKDLAELRALLDAPAIKPRPFGYWLTPKTCAGLAMFQRELIEDPVLTASVVEYFHVTPLYDAPAKPQGEPVYQTRWNRLGEWEEWKTVSLEQYQRSEGRLFERRIVYAEQPAPKTVRMCDCNQGRLPCNGECKP